MEMARGGIGKGRRHYRWQEEALEKTGGDIEKTGGGIRDGRRRHWKRHNEVLEKAGGGIGEDKRRH